MPLIDQHNRQIDYLRISVTDRCNLSCLYCKPRASLQLLRDSDILSFDELHRIVTLVAPLGISRVRITGGEPLARAGIVDFIAAIGSLPGLRDISLTTNGVLLADQLDALREAGMPRLNISLDSLDPVRFREITGSDCWHAVWNGIARAEESGFFPLKINMVPVRGLNDSEVVQFARLTLERRLHIRYIEFMPIGSDDRWTRDACVPSDEVRAAIEREVGPLEPLAAPETGGPSANYQIPGARGIIGFISPITRHFCDSCRRLRLTADGKIRPCLLSDTEIDIRSALRSGCDDQELERLLRLSLAVKPDRHHVADSGANRYQRTMSRIGG